MRASLPRELRQWSETHPHIWFAKRQKNKPTQKIYVSVLCLPYHCCCQKNKPIQKKQSGRMTGGIKGCSVCCVCCRNPTLAKCGGEAQYSEKVGIGVVATLAFGL